MRPRHVRPRGNRNALFALACGAALIGLTTIPAEAQQPVVIGGNGLPEVFVNMDVLNSLGPGYPAQPYGYGYGYGYGAGQPVPQVAPGGGYVTRPGTLLYPPPAFPQSQLTVQTPPVQGGQQLGALPMPQPRIQLTPPGSAAPAQQAPAQQAPAQPAPQAAAPEPATPPPPQPAPQTPVQTAESAPPPPAPPPQETAAAEEQAVPLIPPPTLEAEAPPAPAVPQSTAEAGSDVAAEPSTAAEPPPPPEPDVAGLVPEPEPPALPDTAAGTEQSEPLAPPPPALPPELPEETASAAETADASDTAASPQEAAPQEAALPSPADDGLMRLVFSEGSADLNEAAKDSLRALAGTLLDDGNARVQLLAYASSTDDSASRARRLSLSRALAVRAFLIDQGVRSTRMDVRALGNKLEDGPADRVDILPARR